MSANEIQNHIEAACWLRNGPAPGEGPWDQPVQYFRCQNGFENVIGIVPPEGSTPTVLLLLDRQYTRNETCVFAYAPATADLVYTGATPSLAVYPIAPMLQVRATPVDRRPFIDPTFVAPVDPIEAVALYEKYDAILIQTFDFEAGDIFADLCVQVVRVPRGPIPAPTYVALITP